MLGLKSLLLPYSSTPIPIATKPQSFSPNSFTPKSLTLKPQYLIPKKPTRFLVFAEDGDSKNNKADELKQEQQQSQNQGIGSEGSDDSNQNGKPLFNFRWGDLLDPEPENFLAIGLTGLLTWASVQVLWQLFFISVAILLAALKYSFIAALLIFILITLL